MMIVSFEDSPYFNDKVVPLALICQKLIRHDHIPSSNMTPFNNYVQ
jgi:hypothetical protein